jgi:hypothetical protein
MLTREIAKAISTAADSKCNNCGHAAKITMHGYGEGGTCDLCADCAMQLARKIMEDLCELLAKGGRHG